MEDEVQTMLQFLLQNPLYLAPILFVAAMILYGLLKKLLKLAAIGAIAGGLYIALVRYMGM